jgi:hypothetical protein
VKIVDRSCWEETGCEVGGSAEGLSPVSGALIDIQPQLLDPEFEEPTHSRRFVADELRPARRRFPQSGREVICLSDAESRAGCGHG